MWLRMWLWLLDWLNGFIVVGIVWHSSIGIVVQWLLLILLVLELLLLLLLELLLMIGIA